jgi:hypothetical protein
MLTRKTIKPNTQIVVNSVTTWLQSDKMDEEKNIDYSYRG